MTLQNLPATIPIAPPREYPLSHIADHHRCYPGETVHFATRYQTQSKEKASRVIISIPAGMELVMYTPHPDWVRQSYIRDDAGGLEISLILSDKLPGHTPLVVDTEVRILPTSRDMDLSSQAAVLDAKGSPIDSERISVLVKYQSEYMHYLPEIYAESDFLGRFLMLFESFWNPIKNQIDEGENYYDADMAPAEFIPWLASWIGVSWDQNLSEPRRRKMLRHALSIYQRRGTRQALQDFLQIYTAGEVRIVENRTQNFVLGKKSYLGHTIALGKYNFPHTFTVYLKVPPSEIKSIPGADDRQKRKNYQRLIEALIDTQKPAHTAFKLNLEVVSSTSINPDDLSLS